MTYFEDQFFQKIKFSPEQIERYLSSAKRDLEIASKSDVPEIIFKFAYDSLIKLGINLIAKEGYKVRSQIGHHVKILEKLGQLLMAEDVLILGNKMRQERNTDFYGGGDYISEKDSLEYLKMVESAFGKAGINLEGEN